MSGPAKLGVGRRMVSVPGFVWRTAVGRAAKSARKDLAFMSADHRRVRDFSVLELARTGAPLAASSIAAKLSIQEERVESILDDLETRLTFLYRSHGSEVTWAYPITVDATPHRAKFHTGEEAYSP